DQDETQAYIEHRLKCAGSKGSPRFDAGAFEALFEASGGVPRRINAHCDRLLLAGFLNGKSEFTRSDVEEVARELREETQATAPAAVAGGVDAAQSAAHPQLTDSGILDIDLSRVALDGSTADQAARVIADLKSGQSEQRLIRIERSMFRLERNNAAILSLLQQLVDAVRVKQ
ncbi:MAG TPA: ATPase, partial [Candidatus Accumulibacter sp.]|nr:ATPase [Accumulibacter sp.]